MALICGACDSEPEEPVGSESPGGKVDEIDTDGDTDAGLDTDAGFDTDAGLDTDGETDGSAQAEAWDTFLQEAADPDLRFLSIPDTERPVGQYRRPSAEGYNLSGPEFWERWPGGDTQEFNQANATDNGLKCAIAAAERWEALHLDPPEEFVQLREQQNWRGNYFNWIEDVSEGGSIRFPTGWWAWRTGTMKFISTVHPDGTCELPTRELMRVTGVICGARGDANDGETQGCQTVH